MTQEPVIIRTKNLIKSNDIYDIYEENFEGYNFKMVYAYAKNGLLIGDEAHAKHLVDTFKIDIFDKIREDSSMATIGFSSSNQRWYGWSHRAEASFGIGDLVMVTRDSMVKQIPMDIESIDIEPAHRNDLTVFCYDLNLAKNLAIEFAKSVS